MCKPTNLSSTSGTKARAPSPKSVATKNFEGCGVDRSCPTSVTSHSTHKVRLDQYQSQPIRKRHSSGNSDHEFVWYDLDAVRDKASHSKCDGKAGLLFTTQGQVWNEKAEANRVCAPQKSSKQLLEFDAFVWSTFSLHNDESRHDREFREQIEDLEDELFLGDNEFASSESTMSSFYW